MDNPAAALTETLAEFRFLRGLTLDFLDICTREFLVYSPAPGQGETWKLFRHIGRVQENYLAALESGEMTFNPLSGSYRGGISRLDLGEYLERVGARMDAVHEQIDHRKAIRWEQESCSLHTHLLRLIAHEALHHGQFILYARAGGVSLPKSWGSWGE